MFKWISSIWSEPSGNGSSSRVVITMLIGFIIGVGTIFALSVQNHGITIEQFDSFLSSASEFILLTAGPLYGVNKTADVMKTKKVTNGDSQPNS